MPPIPPQAIDTEKALLGSLLQGVSLKAVEEMLAPHMFGSGNHRVIYRAIMDLYKAGEVVDMLTVGEKLKPKADMDALTPYLMDLIEKCIPSPKITDHARIIKEKYSLQSAGDC